MGTENGKKILFSIDQFVILFFKAYDMIVPSIAALIVINVAFSLWINRNAKPAENRVYRKYLIAQTLFLIVWCPLLWLLLFTARTDLVPVWIVILVAFYLGIGILSLKSAFLGRRKRVALERQEHRKSPERGGHRKKTAKKRKK
jgi:hypothetical protein